MQNIPAQKFEALYEQQVIWLFWNDGEEIYLLFVTDSKIYIFLLAMEKITNCMYTDSIGWLDWIVMQ